VFHSAGLAVVREGDFAATVFGGSDYASQRQIRSGLATNPTFLRVFSGAAVLDSVRLSRDFFGLGPFRSEVLEDLGERFALREMAKAAYYGPLPKERLDPRGVYELADEGRFSAAMDFAHRPTEEVALYTEIAIRIDAAAREVHLDMVAEPGRVGQVLELAFREGGTFEGVREVPEGFEPIGESCAYQRGDDRIDVEVQAEGPKGPKPFYHPGEDYTHLSGSDAAQGLRLYVPLPRTGRCKLVLRAG
jgi:hypothetical protein